MWLLLKIIISLLTAIFRISQRISPVDAPDAGQYLGTPYSEIVKHNKSSEIVGFKVGIPLASGVLFRLHAEDASDRLFKSLGLATEFQTMDEGFDEHIYLACDYPAFGPFLAQDATARELILQLLKQPGVSSVVSDGEYLWLEKYIQRVVNETELKPLAALAVCLKPLCQQTTAKRDPFFWRFLLVESFSWSLVGFAAAAYMEYLWSEQDYFIEPMSLLGVGTLVGAMLFSVLMVLISLLLRGSARGQLIIRESFLLLLLALPVGGMQLTSDINRKFDQSQPLQLTVNVSEVQRSARKKWFGRQHYMILVEQPKVYGQPLPRKMKISQSLYQKLKPGQTVQLTIKPGFLGLPWYNAKLD